MLILTKDPRCSKEGRIKQRYFTEVNEPRVCYSGKGTCNDFDADSKDDKHQ